VDGLSRVLLSPHRLGSIAPALVGLVTLLVFLPALGNQFVNWDDEVNLVSNPHFRGLGWDQLRWMFSNTLGGHYIPVTWLSFGLDYVLWGMRPAGYHATSVVLHTVNGILFYFVARRLLHAAVEADGPTVTLGAAVAALLFSLHPLRVESVAWATERRDVLMGLWAFLCVLAYLRAVDRGGAGALHRGWQWTAVGLFGLALLSKSVVVGLPVVLFLLDVYPLRRWRRRSAAGPLTSGARPLFRLAIEKAPFVALAAAVAALTLTVGAGHRLMTSLETLGVVQRLAISAYALAFYLWKTVAPWPLSPLYTLFHPVVPWSSTYVVPAAFVVLVTLAALLAYRRWPAGLIAWASYVVLLAPVIGVLHNGAQIAADRYTYLSCAPWAILGGAGVAWCRHAALRQKLSPPVWTVVIGAAALVIVAFAALTIRQEAVWRDSVSLWTHAASVEPASDIPIFYLGWALTDAGRFDDARAHLQGALRRVPDQLPDLKAQLDLHLGIVEQRAGRPAAAERYFREALAQDPTHAVALIRLGTILLQEGRATEAEAAWTRAVEAEARWNRHQLWELGQAIEQVPTARASARGRLALALGALLQRHRELEQAEQQYRLATALVPDNADAWNNLGVAYALRGSMKQALNGFIRALQLKPGDPQACRNARRAAAELGASPQELGSCGVRSG
jgi:tetratricopeptide (TPR) repeat protein